MSSTMVVNSPAKGLSAAQKLMQKHQEAYNPIIEENISNNSLLTTTLGTRNFTFDSQKVHDVTPLPARASDKQQIDPVSKKDNHVLDTQSDKLFPGLGTGVPKKVAAPVWGANKLTLDGQSQSIPNNSSSNDSCISSEVASTSPPSRVLPPSLAGQIQAPLLTLCSKDILPRNQLKKPIPDLLKDINKKLRTNLVMMTGEGGVLEFRENSNQKETLKQQAIKELGALVGIKKSIKIVVPRSVKAYIIGKQGSTINALQESTGAKIQLPKSEEVSIPADEDDVMIDVIIEGNPVALQLAQKEISKIVSERSINIQLRLRSIPSEFYPFIAGPNDVSVSALEQAHNVQIRTPPSHIWTTQPPPQKPSAGQSPIFTPNPLSEEFITITGDRANAQAAQAEIEQLAQKLRRELTVEQFMVNNSQHQFVIGKQGVSPQVFFANTGCGIILPQDSNEDSITVVGHPERIEHAMDYAIDLASSMNQTVIDVSRLYRNAQGSARMHARNVTLYLRDRNEIEKICGRYHIHIATPMDSDGAAAWEIFYRSENSKIATKAQNEIGNIILAHPPSRMATLQADPFFHDYLRRDVTPRVKKNYGVHMVIPRGNITEENVLLVYEGKPDDDSDYQIPREKPDHEQLVLFESALADARKYILGILSRQAQITETTIDVPRIFHEKLRRFIQKEQKNRADDQIPVRVFGSGTKITLRGPEPSVEAISNKVNDFVAQAIEDEKERDFTLSFNFPQKHANQLIGKGGSHIRDLKEKFDVEINVNDGTVDVKGPRAKSEAAKTHIITLGRQWADEVTYILKIDPIFHRELIGAQGNQINRLQTRYKVQIYFPRSAKPVRDDQSNADTASEFGRRGSRREQEPDEVIVKGPKKGAGEARDEILSLLQYLKDNSFTATVSVQAGQLPSLIGQRGSGMEEIRQTTMAKIEIPNAKDVKDPSIRVDIQIKGTKLSVAQAKKLIEEKKKVFDDTVTKTLEIDKKHHKALIGAQGSTLRDIILKAGGSDNRRELARTVQFPKSESQDNLIKVEGNSELVEKIITAMQKIVHDRETMTSDTLDVPIERHRTIIGRNGEAKKELENTFKVSLEIPRQGSGLTEVKIFGQPENVEKAKARLRELVSEQKGETIQIPRNIHHDVADNGQIFRKLRNDYHVSIDHGGHKVPSKPVLAFNGHSNGTRLPLITDNEAETKDSYIFSTVDITHAREDGCIPWILRGSAENVAKAKSYIETSVERAIKNTTHGFLFLPDPGTYRYVVGQGGSKVQSIRNATGCKITVPRDNSSEEAIEIIGTTEEIENAKNMILMAVKDGINASSVKKSFDNGKNKY